RMGCAIDLSYGRRGDICVFHCRIQRRMPEQMLDVSNVCPIVNRVRCERMSQLMRRNTAKAREDSCLSRLTKEHSAFPAFATVSYLTIREINIHHVNVDEFANTAACRVKQLKNRSVPGVVGCPNQPANICLGKSPGQASERGARADEPCCKIIDETSATQEV